MDDRHIVAVDLGTSKIGVGVARVTGNDMQVIYYKESPSDGIRASNIYNPKRASEAIGKAIREAEEELGLNIWQVVVCRPKYEVRQVNATGTMNRDENECISEEEIADLKEMALNEFPLDKPEIQEIFGAVAQSFSTSEDFQLMERDIVGMMSDKLEGMFKLFIGSRRSMVSMENTFRMLGIMIAEKYFTPDLTAKSVLFDTEMDNGVALIDFGAGVTSVSIYCRNVMRHYASIPFGGWSITNDIKSICPVSEELAENIKLGYGVCIPDKLQNLGGKTLRIAGDDGLYRDLTVKKLSEVVTARAEELVEAMLYEIEQSGMASNLKSGIVITGGGAELANLGNLIKQKSRFNVRVGNCKKMFSAADCEEIYLPSATAVTGMLLKAKSRPDLDCAEQSGESRAERLRRLEEERKEKERIENEKRAAEEAAAKAEREAWEKAEQAARKAQELQDAADVDKSKLEDEKKAADKAAKDADDEKQRIINENKKLMEALKRKQEEAEEKEARRREEEERVKAQKREEEEKRRQDEIKAKQVEAAKKRKIRAKVIAWVGTLFEDVAEE
ncbi:MAG: cell division protein FtsA [Bacteroidales bacterium]|nr:cell division protein FtsA [Bacteroidales bacterium]